MPIKLSVIVPCYNERATIQLLLDAIAAQTYPLSQMEVVIADGGSTDGTPAAVADWQVAHPDVTIKLIENPQRIIPAALNAAIKASTGEIIVRLDAHSKPHPDYLERAAAALAAGQAENVGGIWEIRPGGEHWIAKSIAAAAGHPIGVGDARYRFSEKPAFVDTVPFGAFNRQLLKKVGLFDETLLTNEDYEFNTRIRQQGGRVWFDPQIRSVYYARSSLKALAHQYWRYGYWKVQMLRRYPGTIRWRQALPPLFIASLIGLILLATFFKIALWLLAGLIAVYTAILCFAGTQLAVKHKTCAFVFGVPLSIATMHFAWGAGFLWGLVHPPNQNKG